MKKIIGLSFVLFCLAVIQVAAASEDALFEEGVALLKQEKAGEAVERFTQVLDLVPDHPDAYRNRGVGYMKLNEYDKAISDFEKALALKPDLKDLYSNLGVAWYYKKDYQRAIEYYDKELALRPLNHFGYFNRAICWAALKRFEKGLADVNKSLELYPDHYLALCLQGDLLRETGQPALAARAYRRAIALDPVQSYARKQLAALAPVSLESDSLASSRSDAAPGSGSPSGTAPGPQVFEVQIGAYLVKGNAENMIEILKEKGYSARILELTGSKGRQWYMVRTGRFENREDARDILMKIEAETGRQGVVRPLGRF